jgi:putative sterol carrier protein
MEKPTTIAELMQQMPGAFLPDKAGSVNTVVQFNLSGEGGGTWAVKIADGKCEVSEGKADAPKSTVTASATDYLAIARGELNAVSAFMGGKLKVAGDMSLMMKFMDWFARP